MDNKKTKLLLEFGAGFAFMGRQYPIQVETERFSIYERALAYRELTGHTVRKSYWKNLTAQVYIDLDIECR